MSSELLILIVLHFACADLTETQRPTLSEVEHCQAIYDDIKLAFVPGVSADNYAGLSAEEKAAVNSAGFHAFSEWRERNADTVSHLRRVARGEESLKAPNQL